VTSKGTRLTLAELLDVPDTMRVVEELAAKLSPAFVGREWLHGHMQIGSAGRYFFELGRVYERVDSRMGGFVAGFVQLLTIAKGQEAAS
jgi:hypothetical protein